MMQYLYLRQDDISHYVNNFKVSLKLILKHCKGNQFPSIGTQYLKNKLTDMIMIRNLITQILYYYMRVQSQNVTKEQEIENLFLLI